MKNPFKKEKDRFGRPVEAISNDVFVTKFVRIPLKVICCECGIINRREFEASLDRSTQQLMYCSICLAQNKVIVPAANEYEGKEE